MKYQVNYSNESRQDLRDIFTYVSEHLMAPGTAADLVNRIMDAVESMEEDPFRYPIYHLEPWKSKGIRFIPVGNYLIFYLPDENLMRVDIVRIMYGGRDTTNLFI